MTSNVDRTKLYYLNITETQNMLNSLLTITSVSITRRFLKDDTSKAVLGKKLKY